MKIQAIYQIKHRDEVQEFETPEEAQAVWDKIYKDGQQSHEHCNMSSICTVPMYLKSSIVMYDRDVFNNYTYYDLVTVFRRVA